ncbi:WXG100 family type VII secretion target [Streptomyces sp. NPDC059080]|uniref:WXG100 family type VII secretion target n=1 Tax=Streptomyces sp. NPDC059080 TaxID=3346718 RepID=UPI003679AA34
MAGIDGSSILVRQELETAGKHINDLSEQIAEELHQLVLLLQPISETWSGQAQVYYEGLQAEWNTAAEGLFGPGGVLGQIAMAMNVNWSNYSEAEWANQRTWQNSAS